MSETYDFTDILSIEKTNNSILDAINSTIGDNDARTMTSEQVAASNNQIEQNKKDYESAYDALKSVKTIGETLSAAPAMIVKILGISGAIVGILALLWIADKGSSIYKNTKGGKK